jgi:PGF-pre-PGF domain-containing protein
MSEANAGLDEIMANPSFRKALHIIGTVASGYILLMLTLFILDTTHLGTAWLETNQDTGFFIIILVLISLLFLMDHAISYARRYYGEEKNSIIDVGLTVAISNIEKYESKSPETFKPLIQKILTLSSTKEKKPPEIVEPVKQKPVEIPASTEPKPEIHDDSNVIFSDTIPILVMKGKRIIKAFEANHSITVIDFKSKVTQKNVKLTVESLNAPSQEAKPIKNELVYEYNNIHINLENEYIEKAVVRFKVRRDWILKNNINIMQLQQYIHDDWTVLPTEVIGQDARYLFFEVYAPSFSLPFAIVGI